jgi:hypothetical protein
MSAKYEAGASLNKAQSFPRFGIAKWVKGRRSKEYRRRLAEGWRDTGFRREWCGGQLKTVLLCDDECQNATNAHDSANR